MNNIIFNNTVNPAMLIIATAFRVGSAIFFLMIMRRAMILVGIRNGLIILRKLLLASSIVMFVTAVVSIALSIVRPFVDPSLFGCFTDWLTVVNAIGFFFLGYIQYKIQSFQYSPRQLDLHTKIAALEKKEDDQEDKKEKTRIKLNSDRRAETIRRNK